MVRGYAWVARGRWSKKLCYVKLGLSNAMLSLFSHMGDFTPVHAKPSFCSTAGPTLCVARSFSNQAMVQSTATPRAQLGRRKRSSPPTRATTRPAPL